MSGSSQSPTKVVNLPTGQIGLPAGGDLWRDGDVLKQRREIADGRRRIAPRDDGRDRTQTVSAATARNK
jgi:hypothetical protein